MAKKYFKVVIREPLKVPLTVDDHRSAPNHYFKIEEYQERMIEVEYSLLHDTDTEKFDQLIKKAIKLNYKNIHSIIEVKPQENLIENNYGSTR